MSAPRRRAILLSALVLVCGGRLTAQQTPDPAPEAATAPEAPASAPERPVLELTLDDAVQRALEGNADIRVQKLNPELAATDITAAEGLYDVALSGDVTRGRRTLAQTSVFSGASKLEFNTWNYNLRASKQLATGATLSLAFENGREVNNNTFATINPKFDSSITANVTQPLLRFRDYDAGRQRLRVARLNKEVSDASFRQLVVGTVANVKKLYYDLIFAIDNLETQRKNLALAKKLLDENRIRVRVGTLAPLDVVAAESEVASREEAVIVAENGLAEAEDTLKKAVFPENDARTWALRVVPTDRPTAEPRAVDLEAAIARALTQRLDLQSARKAVETREADLRFARSQFQPQINLVGSYGAAGQGGTQILRQDPTDPRSPVVGTIPGGFGDAFSGALERDLPTWSLGVSFAYPIGNRQARAASARARLSREQAVASVKRLELLVAGEVRTAARAVETNSKRVESTRAASRLARERLEAEEKRFAAGMSTNFLVTQAQRDLAQAEVSEVRAMADYRKSLIDFDRVQEAGSGGGGF